MGNSCIVKDLFISLSIVLLEDLERLSREYQMVHGLEGFVKYSVLLYYIFRGHLCASDLYKEMLSDINGFKSYRYKNSLS